ncbi:cytokine receptor family member b4 isoform X2 [Danio rerio]|uniref:Cytokine receptor family member b4 isoform X2 n=1 Tax=Danio rerio TaxID=7955 RepID=A0AC58GF94_DANRE
MSAFISFSVVLFNIIGVITVLSENVPVPENVRVISINLGLVLEWDPPQTTNNHPFKYTAELKGWRGYDPVCQNSSSLTCDFTDNVTIFGSYQLRVRTELDGETSDWVETKQVAVDKITEISAPHVELRSNNGQTEVDITDPPMKRKNLRDVFGNISYLIRFWKKGESNKMYTLSLPMTDTHFGKLAPSLHIEEPTLSSLTRLCLQTQQQGPVSGSHNRSDEGNAAGKEK